MRIERVERLRVDRWLFVQIHTDSGLVGLGEAGMWGYPDANDAVIASWEPYLIGKDPLRIEHHWQALYRLQHFRSGAITGALGAIDAALWDIAGQHFETPVYQLLGGKVRDKVRVQTGIHASSIDGLVAQAKAEVARGITALRVTPFSANFPAMRHDELIAEAVAQVGAVREAVGKGVDIGVEIHRRMTAATAISLARELEVFRPLYYEDPIPPSSIQAQGEIARAINLPLAAGERLQNIWEFRELLACEGARYLRIDPCLTGGLTPSKKVAGIAESYGVELIPHGALSSIATAIAVQLDACIPNFMLQDYLGDDLPPKNDFLVENLVLESGYLIVPDRPGIGVRLKSGLAERYPPIVRPPDPAFHEDGSIADR